MVLNLIDGNYELSRGVYSKGSIDFKMATDQGHFTSGVYMFLKSMIHHKRLCNNCIVVFDGGHSSKRLEISEDYKKLRREKGKKEADTFKEVYIRESFKFARENLPKLLNYAGIPNITIKGQEADDIIYRIAEQESRNQKIIVTSMDGDYQQCLQLKNIELYKSMTKTIYTYEDFFREYEIKPKLYSLALALAGDSKDGVIGIKGLGIKTAIKILKEYEGDPSVEDFFTWWNNEGVNKTYTRVSDTLKPRITSAYDLVSINFKLKDLRTNPVSVILVEKALTLAKRRANKDLDSFARTLKKLQFKNLNKYVQGLF